MSVLSKHPRAAGVFFARPSFTWRQDLWVLFTLSLVFFGAFQLFKPALSGPFVLDDFSNISHLSIIAGELTPERIGEYLYSFSGSMGRPLSALSFLINDATWPTDPEPFKYTNLLLHLINGLLVFLLILRLARDLPTGKMQFVAVATTAMWLVAPLQVASVMLTVQRMALLSSFFSLLGLLLHVRSIQTTTELSTTRAFFLLARLAVFTLLAFLCKENGALIPLFAVCLHATLLRKNLSEKNLQVRRLLIYGAAAPWIAVLLYFVTHPTYVTQGYGSGRDFTLVERLMTEARVLWNYVGNIVLPRIGGHGVFHDDYLVSRSLFQPLTTLFSIGVWAILIPLAIIGRKSAPLLAFSVLWFLCGHLMESTVISLEIYFEHRNYLAMLGPLLLIAWGLASLQRRFAIPIFLLWIFFACLSTASNARVWGSAERMANVWFAEHPNSVRAIQLKASKLTSRGQIDAATTILEDGYRRLPENSELIFQTLPLRCGAGTMSRELLPRYFRAASNARTPQIPANQLSDLRHIALQCGQSFTLRDWWTITDLLLRNPKMRVSGNAMAHIHYQRAQAAVEERNLDLAMSELDLSYKAEPNPFIAREQATYLMSAGLFKDALRYLDKSESTPTGFWKQWTFSARSMNEDMRQAINEAMLSGDMNSAKD